MESLFNVTPVKQKVFDNIKKIIMGRLNKKVTNVYKISNRKGVTKTFKIDIENSPSLRLDIRFPGNLNRLQKVATNHNIEMPKIVFIQDGYKFSEWVEGVMLHKVWDIADVFIKSGDLVGRLNKVRDPQTKGFLMNAEFSSTNAIYTNSKKVYIIDHDRLKTSSNPDASVVQIALKRIREKERILLFLESYSKHRKIDEIMKAIEKRNWNWDERKKLVTNAPKLRY